MSHGAKQLISAVSHFGLRFDQVWVVTSIARTHVLHLVLGARDGFLIGLHRVNMPKLIPPKTHTTPIVYIILTQSHGQSKQQASND